MLTCKELVAAASDDLDGQLGFRKKFMVRHHLLFCSNCRRFVRQLRLVRATVRAMPQEGVPDVDMLAERLGRERNKTP